MKFKFLTPIFLGNYTASIVALFFFGTTFGYTPLSSVGYGETGDSESNRALLVDSFSERVGIRVPHYFVLRSDLFRYNTVLFTKGWSNDRGLREKRYIDLPIPFKIENNVFLSRSVLNQDRTISGTVTDENGVPLPGVNITVEGTSTGTSTDFDGKYEIGVITEQSVLRFSFIGFEDQLLEVGNQSEIDVQMVSTGQELDEIVIAYGTQKRGNLTGSISSIKAEDVGDRIAVSPAELIDGNAAGVDVVTNSGEPGGGISVNIRGSSSINAGTDPLYVIDGQPLQGTSAVTGSGADFVDSPSKQNPLATINPNDIESIEVLKDASATALYGSRGANGVIMITTKKGRSGRMDVGYNGYIGVQSVANRLNLLSAEEYRSVLNGLIDDGASSESDRINEIIGGGTDWQSEIFRKALIQNHDFSFSGGDEKTTYFASLNYFDQDGTVKGSKYQKYNARLNLTMTPNKDWEFGVNFNINYSEDNHAPSGFGINGEAGSVYGAINFDPSVPLRDSEGNYTEPSYLDMDNPVAQLEGKNSLQRNLHTFGTVYGQYTIFPGLVAKLNLGADILNSRKDVYVNRLVKHGRGSSGIATILQGVNRSFLSEGTLNYKKDFDQHSLDVLFGATYQRFVGDNTNISATGFPSDEFETFSIGQGDQSTYDIGSNKSTNALGSFLGRVQYSFKDKYLLTGAIRADGSSRFGNQNRFGYFPSFSGGWKLHEEGFMDGIGFIDELKLKGSWGQTGNQNIGNYPSVSTFSGGAKAILDGSLVSTLVPTRLSNPDLKWETTEQWDVGIDFAILNDRIIGSMDYFKKTTKDMLFDLPVPTSSGFQSRLENIGSAETSGFEFSLNTKNIVGQFNWSSSLNLSTLKSSLKSIGGISRIITGGAGQTSQLFLLEPGNPLYSFYGYKIDGIWQEGDGFSNVDPNINPGDIKYRDINGDGRINSSDRVVLGNSYPKFSWSFRNTFRYKKLQLDILIQGKQGFKMLNNNLVDTYFPVQFRRNRLAKPYLNRWTPENPSKKYPSFVNPTSQGNKDVNSYTVEDASYTRLKSVTLGYKFDLKHSFIENVRIYITGENLLTITGYSGYDPAINPNGNNFQKIDFNAYPLARTYTFGLSFNF